MCFHQQLKQLSVVAGLLILSGCSTLSSLNPFSKADTKNVPAVLEEIKTSMAVKTKWTNAIGSSGSYLFAPAQIGDAIFAAAADGIVMKIDSASGRVMWRSNAQMPLTAGVGANVNTVAVAGQKGMLLAFDSQGSLRWKIQTSSEILSSPLVTTDLVVVRSIDNKIVAYDIATGARKWVVERPIPALTLRIDTGMIANEQTVFVASPGGKLLALALNNGGLIWEATAADPKGATELERLVDASGTPIIVGSNVCISSYQGRVGCFDLATGAIRWAKNMSSEVGVGGDERFVFAADNDGKLLAYAISGGANVWKNEKLLHRNLSAPVSFGRAVVVGDRFGYVHFLSREDGAFIARISTDGSQILPNAIVVGSSLIVQTKSGAVVALSTE